MRGDCLKKMEYRFDGAWQSGGNDANANFHINFLHMIKFILESKGNRMLNFEGGLDLVLRCYTMICMQCSHNFSHFDTLASPINLLCVIFRLRYDCYEC